MGIGLFFGSFNPVHQGHLILAQEVLQHTDLQEIWFVVSPQSPFKERHELVDAEHRIAMLELCLGDHDQMKICDIELGLPMPSYTIDTLRALDRLHPDEHFKLLLGSDNMISFGAWKDQDKILADYDILVYPRPGQEAPEWDDHGAVQLLPDLPLLDISSTYIRKNLQSDRLIKFLTPDLVIEYINKYELYRWLEE